MVHRDLKPQNIMMSKVEPKIEIKLTDFGFATYFKYCEKLNQQLGTPLYMAPEIIKGEEYNSKVDIWSAGVILF